MYLSTLKNGKCCQKLTNSNRLFLQEGFASLLKGHKPKTVGNCYAIKNVETFWKNLCALAM